MKKGVIGRNAKPPNYIIPLVLDNTALSVLSSSGVIIPLK